MSDPQCLVCGYECDEVSDKGLCDNCQNAYELGYNQAKGEL